MNKIELRASKRGQEYTLVRLRPEIIDSGRMKVSKGDKVIISDQEGKDCDVYQILRKKVDLREAAYLVVECLKRGEPKKED